MGAMPELMSSRLASFWGIREKLGRRRCPLVSKKDRNISRSSFKPKGLGSYMGITSNIFLLSYFVWISRPMSTISVSKAMR